MIAMRTAGWCALPLILAPLVGCASAPNDERIAFAHRVPADIVLVGRFVASEDIEVFHPMGGGELSHVAEAWRSSPSKPPGNRPPG
jgi:hypothetical protein